MKKLAVGMALGCVFALVLCLVGCGGAGKGADPVEQSKEAFTGTWDLSGMEENGETTSSADLETLKSYGLEVYLQLDEGGKAALHLFGEVTDGTWEPKTASEATITLADDKVDMLIQDGELSMTQGSAKLVFKKGTPRSTASSEAASSAGSEAASSQASSSASSSASSASAEAASSQAASSASAEAASSGASAEAAPSSGESTSAQAASPEAASAEAASSQAASSAGSEAASSGAASPAGA